MQDNRQPESMMDFLSSLSGCHEESCQHAQDAEKLRQLLKCATKELESARNAAKAQNQLHDARVRYLEEQLNVSKREKEEVQEQLGMMEMRMVGTQGLNDSQVTQKPIGISGQKFDNKYLLALVEENNSNVEIQASGKGVVPNSHHSQQPNQDGIGVQMNEGQSSQHVGMPHLIEQCLQMEINKLGESIQSGEAAAEQQIRQIEQQLAMEIGGHRQQDTSNSQLDLAMQYSAMDSQQLQPCISYDQNKLSTSDQRNMMDIAMMNDPMLEPIQATLQQKHHLVQSLVGSSLQGGMQEAVEGEAVVRSASDGQSLEMDSTHVQQLVQQVQAQQFLHQAQLQEQHELKQRQQQQQHLLQQQHLQQQQKLQIESVHGDQQQSSISQQHQHQQMVQIDHLQQQPQQKADQFIQQQQQQMDHQQQFIHQGQLDQQQQFLQQQVDQQQQFLQQVDHQKQFLQQHQKQVDQQQIIQQQHFQMDLMSQQPSEHQMMQLQREVSMQQQKHIFAQQQLQQQHSHHMMPQGLTMDHSAQEMAQSQMQDIPLGLKQELQHTLHMEQGLQDNSLEAIHFTQSAGITHLQRKPNDIETSPSLPVQLEAAELKSVPSNVDVKAVRSDSPMVHVLPISQSPQAVFINATGPSWSFHSSQVPSPMSTIKIPMRSGVHASTVATPINALVQAIASSKIVPTETVQWNQVNARQQQHLPEPSQAELSVLLHSLPQQGELMKAVVESGPTLHQLMAQRMLSNHVDGHQGSIESAGIYVPAATVSVPSQLQTVVNNGLHIPLQMQAVGPVGGNYRCLTPAGIAIPAKIVNGWQGSPMISQVNPQGMTGHLFVQDLHSSVAIEQQAALGQQPHHAEFGRLF